MCQRCLAWGGGKVTNLVLPLLLLIQNSLLSFLFRILRPQLLKLCLLFFFSKGSNLFCALGKIDMFPTKEFGSAHYCTKGYS
jgi:hypothetical protein